MMEMMESQRHATDGDLVRLLDRETTAADAELGAHVAECSECRTRLARLRSRSERIAAELRSADVPPVDSARIRPPLDQLSIARLRRRRRAVALWSRPGLRAAAGLLLLAGVAAASPTTRGWIREQVARLPAPTPTPRAEPSPSTPPAPQGGGARISFAPPSGAELVIHFDTMPSGGTLAIGVGADERASAQVVARASGEAFLVLPGELRIRNDVSSTADYRVDVPRRVRRVRVHVGSDDASPVVVDVTPGTPRVVDLRRPPDSG